MTARLSHRERSVVFALVSRLLRYPDRELLDDLPLLGEAAGGLPASVRAPLGGLVAHLAATPLLALQADYVATFDLRRRNCLYLTYFLNGDTRRRGAALWRFRDLYRRYGLVTADGELADFLPVLLELVAETPAGDPEPLDTLLEHLAGISVLRRSLESSESPWAGAVLALERSLPRPSAAVLAAAERIATEGPPLEQVGIEAYGQPAAGGGRR